MKHYFHYIPGAPAELLKIAAYMDKLHERINGLVTARTELSREIEAAQAAYDKLEQNTLTALLESDWTQQDIIAAKEQTLTQHKKAA